MEAKIGLDMYFYGRRYLWSAADEPKQQAMAQLFPEIHGAKIDEVKANFKYWRKFNALHRWFVDNVQDGVDECQEAEVTVEHLHRLRDICAAIIADPSQASVLLPTSDGFFFGSTAYDEYYFNDVKDTHLWLNNFLLKESFDMLKGWYFYYRSSW